MKEELHAGGKLGGSPPKAAEPGTLAVGTMVEPHDTEERVQDRNKRGLEQGKLPMSVHHPQWGSKPPETLRTR